MLRKSIPVLMILFFLSISSTAIRGQTVSTSTTPTDHDLLIELRTKIIEIDKRFEQIDKRFMELREDMNKRFEQIMSFMWILAAIFSVMTAATIGFALWDRRTMIRPFETKVAELDSRITKNREYYEQLVAFLKEYAEKDKKVAAIIQKFNLF